jgi:hypothetical protein
MRKRRFGSFEFIEVELNPIDFVSVDLNNKNKIEDSVKDKEETEEIITESKNFLSGYSELSRLLIFIIFLSLAGYVFYILVFERSIQGKIMRFIASIVPED